MAANFDVSIVLRLIDQLTGPSRAAAASMQRLAGVARGTTSAMQGSTRAMEQGWSGALGRMSAKVTEFGIRTRHAFSQIARGPVQQLQASSSKLSAMRWQMMSTMFFAAPLALPFKAAASNELGLARLGQVAGWKEDTFAEMMQNRNLQIREITRDTKQSASDLLSVYTDLVASGMSEPTALQGLRTLGHTLTATGMEVKDAAQLGFSLEKQFDVAPDQWMDVIGKLHKAGKMGGFELKDMAEWFPRLGAFTKIMGIGGPRGGAFAADLAAFLQVTREGAGNPDEAANNMRNLFQKMFQKETRKNFKKSMGIDLATELKKTVDEGGSPIDKIMELSQKFMEKNKNNPFMLGELFADLQAFQALAALMNKNKDKLAELRKGAQEAGAEEILRDVRTSSGLLTFAFKDLANAFSELNDTLIKDILGETKDVFKVLTGFVRGVNEFVKNHKQFSGNILLGLAALIAFALGIRTVMFVITSLGMAFRMLQVAGLGVLAVIRAIAAVRGPAALAGGAGGMLTAGAAGALAARMGILRGAFYALGAAARFLTGPIGLIGGALLMMVPDAWWSTAANVLTTGFQMLIIIVGGHIDLLKAKIAELTGAMQGIGGGIMVPPGLAPGSVIDPNPAGGKLGTTIPQVADPALRNQSAPVQENKTINSSVSMPITVNVTQTMASPGAIAGAVSGAGQSVAAEVKKSMTDGGQ